MGAGEEGSIELFPPKEPSILRVVGILIAAILHYEHRIW